MTSVSWPELLLVMLALGAGGLVKGVTGVGLPLIAVPLMAGYIGVERAVMTLVIPAIVLNLYQVYTHRDCAWALPEWRRMLVAGIPGALLGATVLHHASDQMLAAALGIWILSYLLFRFLHPSFSLSQASRQHWSPVVGATAGALQAATGISAPVVAAYADALGLPPRAYVFAVCAPFAAFACAHFISLLVVGLYSTEMFVQSSLAVIPALAGIPLGVRLRRYFSRRLFDNLVRVTLFVMALRLLYMAIRSS